MPGGAAARPRSTGRPPRSPERALHLELDEAVELDGVLHRELLREHLEEALDDQVLGLVLRRARGS